jgi:hypothetical protein|tara:strand:+ start:10058 stop:11605 length:1548 start_codon:yes stop_codon:yes gene_type:complete
MGYTNTNKKRTSVNTNWADDNALNESLEFHFPIQDGAIVNKNDFLQLNDEGEVYSVFSTGTKPTTVPMGRGGEWSYELAPETDKDNLTRWIDDTNFIIFFAHMNVFEEGNHEAYLQGGSVDQDGNFYFNKSPMLVGGGNLLEFDFNQIVVEGNFVNGLCSVSEDSWNKQGSFARAFQYSIETQEFTLGETFNDGFPMGQENSPVLTNNVGHNKYLVSCFTQSEIAGNEAFIVTINDNLEISIGKKTGLPEGFSYGNLVRINNDKVILLANTRDARLAAQILNIKGNTIQLGNESRGDFMLFGEILATDKLSIKENKIYILMASTSSNDHLVRELSYDAVRDEVVFSPGEVTLPVRAISTDISFYDGSGVVLIAGVVNTDIPTLFIVDFATSSVVQKVVGDRSALHLGCDVNGRGGVVLSYASNDSSFRAEGLCSYGQIGDLVSNLDYQKTIGVASDSMGHVYVSGSVITNPSLKLKINSRVYVDITGKINTENTPGAVHVGFAITNDSFILEVSR